MTAIKQFTLFLVILTLSVIVFPARLGTLEKVMKPGSIKVDGDELYVMENAVISVYSIKDLSLKRQFSGAGEGPGELKLTPMYVNHINIFPDYLIAEGIDKLIFFTKSGKIIKELKKKSPSINQTLPVGENFVVTRLRMGEDGKTMLQCVILCNPAMDEIKDLYQARHFQQGAPPAMDMILDATHVQVSRDKIFVEESDKGFLIEVFDSQGNKLYRIEKEFEKIKYTDKDKEEIIQRFQQEPIVKQMGWERVKSMYTMNYPDTFPAIQNFELDADKLYIKTYKKINDKIEYVIMDSKGKVIKKVYLPRFDNTTLMEEISGVKLYSIHNDRLYYLEENKDNEKWELHMEQLR